jgi:hypothetical protein
VNPIHPEPIYRARLRFRLHKKLNLSATEHQFSVAGREVVMKPLNGTTIQESDWLVMNATGFLDEVAARDFGHRLRAALELSSVATRLGIDAGRDIATSGLGRSVKEQIAKETGALVRDNVHGLDVFEDGPNVRFFQVNATGSVLATPDPFLAFVTDIYDVASTVSNRAKDVILLLNYALMRPEPIAQIVFAFSAVEMLGQSETWTRQQKSLLAELAEAAERSLTGSQSERQEGAEAIRKSVHRLTLRQGVIRLLDSLDLMHLRAVWDALYAERSTLIHGLAPRPGADYSDLAHRVLNLCGRILLGAVAAELSIATKYVDTFYELQHSRRHA